MKHLNAIYVRDVDGWRLHWSGRWAWVLVVVSAGLFGEVPANEVREVCMADSVTKAMNVVWVTLGYGV